MGAGPFAANMLLHREHARGVVQLLADVLANTLQLAATIASGAVGFMMDVDTGQSCRQAGPFGLLAGLGRGFCSRCQRLEFLLNGGNVRLNRFLDQTDLSPIELLTAAPEFPALERGQFVGEFVDLGLPVQDVAVTSGDHLALQGDPGDQLGTEFAQLFCVQMLE